MSGFDSFIVLKVSIRQLNFSGTEFVVWTGVKENLNMRTVANIIKRESIQMGNIGSGRKTFVEIPENYNAIAYILDGEVTLNENFSYKSETLLYFRNDGSGFSFKTVEF